MSHANVVDLVPLYALGALEERETAAVEAHLANCELCANELAIYESVTASLVPDGPAPTHLWAGIEAEISPEDDVELSHIAEVIPMAQPPNRRRLVWFASIAAAAAVVFGGIAIAQRSVLGHLTGDAAIVAAAEQASAEEGTFVGDFVVDEAAVAQVVLTSDGQGFVLPSDSLETLPAERTYQLWVITADEQVISGGVLGNDPGASTFTWTGEVSGFALTREIAGGVVVSEGDVVSVLTTA